MKRFLIPFMMAAGAFVADAAPVKVIMNNESTTMQMVAKATGEAVETGEPNNKKEYTFDVPAGEYVLTGISKKNDIVNGTIVITVEDKAEEQEFKILTCTAYVTNKDTEGHVWTVENGDYTLDITVNSREGLAQTITVGNSSTAGRKTFLALNGNSYYADFIPSEAHRQEGYVDLFKSGTLTFNANVYGAMPKGAYLTLTIPDDAKLTIGRKTAHFIPFKVVEPAGEISNGDIKIMKYYLAQGETYSYRTWIEGELTQGGYFRMPKEDTSEAFSRESYKAYNPKQINHDPQSNKGYETGDIFVNINPQGHLKLNVGDTFDAHAMRTWELSDNSTNNYFIEPDFHYTVITPDGRPSAGVIEIDNADTHDNPWSTIRAVGNGTAIVLVTYDAIGLNIGLGDEKSPYMGGEYWGAVWPENTAVYVVTVGENAAGIDPNMQINAQYNKGAQKLAGKYLDAEHDVLYYLDSEEGARYSFTPSGVAKVTVAAPVIGEQSVSYTGFAEEGVKANEDGSYTLLLKKGRNIVKLTDAAGNSAYQVVTVKECTREISNISRPGSTTFQPGDEVKIQYNGLFHPANKLAGIYNMSAYVTYNGNPNGTSLILGAGQYTFGSAAKAQAVTLTIPEDFDTESSGEFVLNDGVIQVNGFGDPVGNHRNISPVAGRSPNFTAVAHKTYFGAIPEVRIPVSPVKMFPIRIICNNTDPMIKVSYKGEVLDPDADGFYRGSYGTYSITAYKSGYRCMRCDYTIGNNAEGEQTVTLTMDKAEGAWDGMTLSEPALTDDGTYIISNGEQLAWFAAHVNEGNTGINAVLDSDIELGDYDWIPVGMQAVYSGNFDGGGHMVSGLYVNESNNNVGLFGSVENAEITGLSVEGYVAGKNNVGGLIGNARYTKIDRCVNYADVDVSGNYGGGIVGRPANSTITNSYNVGNVHGENRWLAGISGTGSGNVAENVFNIGTIEGKSCGSCFGSAPADLKNAFCIEEYSFADGSELVSDSQMRSGEVAYKLGSAFGQEIGVDPHPVIGGMEVKYDRETDTYYNEDFSSIGSVEKDEVTVECYYNIEGMASPTPFKGFNIVRYTDGTTAKIFVKD